MYIKRYAACIFIVISAAVICANCSTNIKRSTIVATTFGSTKPLKRFPMGGAKPHGHVEWGDDVEDGAQCSIIITNISLAQRVYQRDFVYRSSPANDGFAYAKSRIVELDPDWNIKFGRFRITLYIDGGRTSSYAFSIVPAYSSDSVISTE